MIWIGNLAETWREWNGQSLQLVRIHSTKDWSPHPENTACVEALFTLIFIEIREWHPTGSRCDSLLLGNGK
jgi:hypothetical protein